MDFFSTRVLALFSSFCSSSVSPLLAGSLGYALSRNRRLMIAES
jgi:hypothetical protein